ncbi:MAG: DUF4293 family protein [Bacteroidia bacterium]|nr:DUF4293 family protein [Bacteroidia bacterium]
MIQRIQSVYLALAVLFSLLPLGLPVWQYTIAGATETVTALQAQAPEGQVLFFDHASPLALGAHSAWLLLLLAGSGLCGFAIFRYQDRLRQIGLLRIAALLLMLALLALVLLTLQGPAILQGSADQGGAAYGIAFPAIALLLVVLAMRAIRKDEELVRSVDRIR